MSDKPRVEELISRLEMLVGELFSRDNRLAPIVTRMIEDLGGLRSELGLIKRKAATPGEARKDATEA